MESDGHAKAVDDGIHTIVRVQSIDRQSVRDNAMDKFNTTSFGNMRVPPPMFAGADANIEGNNGLQSFANGDVVARSGEYVTHVLKVNDVQKANRFTD